MGHGINAGSASWSYLFLLAVLLVVFQHIWFSYHTSHMSQDSFEAEGDLILFVQIMRSFKTEFSEQASRFSRYKLNTTRTCFLANFHATKIQRELFYEAVAIEYYTRLTVQGLYLDAPCKVGSCDFERMFPARIFVVLSSEVSLWVTPGYCHASAFCPNQWFIWSTIMFSITCLQLSEALHLWTLLLRSSKETCLPWEDRAFAAFDTALWGPFGICTYVVGIS